MSGIRLQRLILLVLIVAVLGASTQAKLSMYQPEHASCANTWQVIKLQQLRIGTVAIAVDVPVLVATGGAVSIDEGRRIPAAPPRLSPGGGPTIPQSHWFRPPPALS